MLVDFINISYYTFHLEDGDDVRKTEIRKYFYEKLACHLEPINLIWENSLGGFDSYQFVNVQETNNITRNTIKKNIFRIDNGYYTDRSGEVLNSSEEIINVTQQGSYTANSGFISDSESYWFNSLFTSTQVFVELSDESLVPVIVTNSSYQIQKQKYNKTSFNSIQVTYTLNGDIIPPDVIAVDAGFGNGSAQVDFIDNQMNYDTEFDTILTFASSVLDGEEGVGGAVASTNANLKFEFNKINPRLGLTNNLSINVSSTLTMVIDFLSDYLGQPFRFTDTAGVQHYGTFINGTVNY